MKFNLLQYDCKDMMNLDGIDDPYFWQNLSDNKTITSDLYIKYRNKPWDHEKLSSSVYINILDAIMKYPCDSYISIFSKFNAISLHEWAAKIIQKKWLGCYYNPKHPICIRRLNGQFLESTHYTYNRKRKFH